MDLQFIQEKIERKARKRLLNAKGVQTTQKTACAMSEYKVGVCYYKNKYGI
jgi:hypothetical protein